MNGCNVIDDILSIVVSSADIIVWVSFDLLNIKVLTLSKYQNMRKRIAVSLILPQR